MSDKAFYQQVVDELNSGNLDAALWAMAWTKAGGDDNKARASYIERRVAELRSQTKQTARGDLRTRWRSELQVFHSHPAWGKAFLLAAANVLYIFWCYHQPSQTGLVAKFGAFVGFNLFPVSLGLLALGLLRNKPATALKVAGIVWVVATGLILLLNVIDTNSQFHGSPPNIYAFTLGDNIPASIGSDEKLTGEQYAQAVKDFNEQWEQAAKDHAQAVADWSQGGAGYWAAQFNKGFRRPLVNALCPHRHKSTDLNLMLAPWVSEAYPDHF